MTTLHDIFGPWAALLNKLEAGKRLTKAEVIQLLNSDEPVPDRAKPFLTDVTLGTANLRGGDISLKENEKPSALLRYVMLRDALDSERTDIETLEVSDRRELTKLRKKMKMQSWPKTPHTLAKRLIADQFNVHPDTLQNWIDELLPK